MPTQPMCKKSIYYSLNSTRWGQNGKAPQIALSSVNLELNQPPTSFTKNYSSTGKLPMLFALNENVNRHQIKLDLLFMNSDLCGIHIQGFRIILYIDHVQLGRWNEKRAGGGGKLLLKGTDKILTTLTIAFLKSHLRSH